MSPLLIRCLWAAAGPLQFALAFCSIPLPTSPALPLQCQYFKNVHAFVNSGYQYRLHDIEDLKGFGKSQKACPYFTARKWADVSGNWKIP